ncbi:MAG TPA: hypothetical protein PLN93_11730 [Vicinamibacterales bacterium]|nr:hypothetical protein [Vicinamibacterales bacterium]HPK72600.1 hypothetical protein [Vicinamibacterales bacterium]
MSWWWVGLACGFWCDPRNPGDLLFTDWGRAIRSTDGGATWSTAFAGRYRCAECRMPRR